MNTLVSKENLEQFSGLLNKEMNEKLIDSIHIKNAFKESDTDLTFDNWIGKLLNRNFMYITVRPIQRSINNTWAPISYEYSSGDESLLIDNLFIAPTDGIGILNVLTFTLPSSTGVTWVGCCKNRNTEFASISNTYEVVGANSISNLSNTGSLCCIVPMTKNETLTVFVFPGANISNLGSILRETHFIFINNGEPAPAMSLTIEEINKLRTLI